MDIEQIWSEFREHQWDEDSISKTNLLKSLLAYSESLQALDLSFEIRIAIIQSSVFSGEIEKAVIAFTHCIAEFDAEAPYTDAHTFDLLWSSTWIHRGVVSVPTIPKKQILAISEDIEQRFEKHDFGLRAHFMKRWLNAKEMGDIEQATLYRKKWVNASVSPNHPRCKACDYHYDLMYDLEKGEIARALDKSERLFRAGHECNRVPLSTTVIILPHIEDAKTTENFENYVENELSKAGADLIDIVADYISYLVSIQAPERAQIFVERFISHAAHTKELDRKHNFFFAVEKFITSTPDLKNAAIFRLLDAKSRDQALTHCVAIVDEITNAFDLRNENSVLSDKIHAVRAKF